MEKNNWEAFCKRMNEDEVFRDKFNHEMLKRSLGDTPPNRDDMLQIMAELGYEVTGEEMNAQGVQELTDDELDAVSGGFIVRGTVGDLGNPRFNELYGADTPAWLIVVDDNGQFYMSFPFMEAQSGDDTKYVLFNATRGSQFASGDYISREGWELLRAGKIDKKTAREYYWMPNPF